MNIFKKNNEKKTTQKLPMTGKVQKLRYGAAKRQYHYLRSSYERRLYVRRSYEIQGQELLGKAQNSIL